MEGFKTTFFRLLSLSLVLDGLFTTPIYLHRRSRFVNSAFPNKKIWTKNRSLFMTNKFESKCLQKFTFQVNRKKNGTGRRRLTSRNRLAIFVNTNSCRKNDTTNPFGYILGESTENKKALLFFSGKERAEFKL